MCPLTEILGKEGFCRLKFWDYFYFFKWFWLDFAHVSSFQNAKNSYTFDHKSYFFLAFNFFYN